MWAGEQHTHTKRYSLEMQIWGLKERSKWEEISYTEWWWKLWKPINDAWASVELEENNAKNTYIRKYYLKNICGKIAEKQIDQELSEKNCR